MAPLVVGIVTLLVLLGGTSGIPDAAADEPPGVVWTAQTAAERNSWQGVTYGNGMFVAVALDGTHRVMTSPDGIT